MTTADVRWLLRLWLFACNLVRAIVQSSRSARSDYGKRIEGIQTGRCVREQRIQLSRAVPGGTAQALYPAPGRSCGAQELRHQPCSGFARWSVVGATHAFQAGRVRLRG